LEAGEIDNPSHDKLEILASVFSMPVEQLYHSIGRFRNPPSGNSEIDALAKVYYSLPPEMRPIALKIMRDLAAAESIEEGDAREERKSKAA
jgi:hypothetical protein